MTTNDSKPPSFPHRIYRRLRPRLVDWGVLRLARRLLPATTRTKIAASVGLGGFDPSTAPGTHPPGMGVWGHARPHYDGLNYIGDLRADIGISEHSRLLLEAMRTVDIPLAYTELSYRTASRTQPLPNGLSAGTPYSVSILDKNFAHLDDVIIEGDPEWFRHKYVIGIWAWELEDFPERWRGEFNLVHEIWVGSRFIQDALARMSPVPIVRIPLPAAPIISDGARRADFGLPDDRFIFFYAFNVTSTAARKNPFGFIEAFRRAFGTPKEKGCPLLVLKAHHLNLPDAALLAPELRAAVASVGGILIEDHYTRTQMNDLLNLCDCYVSLHRGEGFGLTIAEAMALGKPVIATGYSGNMDYMTPTNSYSVGYTIRPITTDDHRYQPHLNSLYEPGMKWADPDLDHAAAYMREVFERPERAHATGERARAYMAQHHSYQRVGERIRERLRVITHSD